jgi:hypothetical protein
MSTRLAADAVLLLHGAFIVFALLGGLWALAWRLAPLLHLPAAGWAVWIELSGGLCPLTTWEDRLRRAAGQAGYETSFVEQHLLPLIYPAGLTPAVQWVLAGVVLLVNVAIYAFVWRRWRTRR